jgi:hypothetical protein
MAAARPEYGAEALRESNECLGFWGRTGRERGVSSTEAVMGDWAPFSARISRERIDE